MRLAHSSGLLFGLTASVLSTPIPGGEHTAPHSWGTYAEYTDDLIAKRQFRYGYGGDGDGDDDDDDDDFLAKRQFGYRYAEGEDDNLAKRQFDYGYAEESEPIWSRLVA